MLLTKAVKRTADLVRGAGMPRVVGRVKASTLVQKLLYLRYTEKARPRPTSLTLDRLRAVFEPDIAVLDRILETDFGQRWAYCGNAS